MDPLSTLPGVPPGTPDPETGITPDTPADVPTTEAGTPSSLPYGIPDPETGYTASNTPSIPTSNTPGIPTGNPASEAQGAGDTPTIPEESTTVTPADTNPLELGMGQKTFKLPMSTLRDMESYALTEGNGQTSHSIGVTLLNNFRLAMDSLQQNKQMQIQLTKVDAERVRLQGENDQLRSFLDSYKGSHPASNQDVDQLKIKLGEAQSELLTLREKDSQQAGYTTELEQKLANLPDAAAAVKKNGELYTQLINDLCEYAASHTYNTQAYFQKAAFELYNHYFPK